MARLSIEALARSAAALQAGDVGAALGVRNREFGQEAGIFDESVSRTMEFILRRTPAILADCPQTVLEPLRVAAAMMELWGVNNIRGFVTIEGKLDYRFGMDAIAYMLHSHGCFLQSLEDFCATDITRVQLLGAHDAAECEVCKQVDGISFAIEDVPELPLATCTCTNKYGCRVMVIADR